MHRSHRLFAVLFTCASVFIAIVAIAGHKPVCCKGYMYWDIYEPHQGGHRWRKVRDPVKMREVPITPSLWNLSEARSRSLLIMHAKAQREAKELQIKARDWDAACWHYDEPEPSRRTWPVQP